MKLLTINSGNRYTDNMTKRAIKYIRKGVVALVGSLVLVIGIILIPLPGPGLLVCLLGLFIFSLEFDWAKPHVERLKRKLKEATQRPKSNK